MSFISFGFTFITLSTHLFNANRIFSNCHVCAIILHYSPEQSEQTIMAQNVFKHFDGPPWNHAALKVREATYSKLSNTCVSMLSLTCLYPSMTYGSVIIRNKYYTIGPPQMRIKLCTRQLNICSVQVIHLNKSLNKYFLYSKTTLSFWTDHDTNLFNGKKKKRIYYRLKGEGKRPNSVMIWRQEQIPNHWLSLPWFSLSDHLRSG